MSDDSVEILKIEGTAIRLVQCECCYAEYTYTVVCASQVTEFLSQEAARRSAEEATTNAIGAQHEPIPCPVCYHIQSYMSLLVASERYRWIAWIALFLILCVLGAGVAFAVAVFGDSRTNQLIAGGVGIFGIVGIGLSFGVWHYLLTSYDANITSNWADVSAYLRQRYTLNNDDADATPEAMRAAVAKERAQLLSDFYQEFAALVPETYRTHLLKSAEADSPSPYVFGQWFKRSDLKPGSVITVRLPTGEPATFRFEEQVVTNSVHQLYSPEGEELPFAVRIYVFDETVLLNDMP